MSLAPRINRLFPVISAAAFLVVFGVACGSQTPEPKFPTPDAHALITPAAFNTGTADLSVWVPDGWSAPINYDEVSLELMITSANRGTTMAEDYSIVFTSDGEFVYRWGKPLLMSGSERVEVLSLNDLPELYGLVQGRHRLELILDPKRSVRKFDRDNNSFSLARD